MKLAILLFALTPYYGAASSVVSCKGTADVEEIKEITKSDRPGSSYGIVDAVIRIKALNSADSAGSTDCNFKVGDKQVAEFSVSNIAKIKRGLVIKFSYNLGCHEVTGCGAASWSIR